MPIDIDIIFFIVLFSLFIGSVRVFYEAKAGSLDPKLPALNLAVIGQDFIGGPSYVDFQDGQSVGSINIIVNEVRVGRAPIRQSKGCWFKSHSSKFVFVQTLKY